MPIRFNENDMCPYTFIYREQEMHVILEAMTALNVYSYLLVCNNKWLRVLPSLKLKNRCSDRLSAC